MAKRHKPRCGTLQYQPRKRALRPFARVRSWPSTKDIKPLAFAGYKVGMTHVIITDNKTTSMTKGQDISLPVTIIECPPLKIASIVFFKNSPYGLKASSAVFADKLDKELARKICIPKKKTEFQEDFDDLRILVYTQPKLTTIGKKKPELFEIALGGKPEEKLAWAKEYLGKEVLITDVFSEGQIVDSKGITTGRGFQGPVKRNGVSLRSHKSEKVIRGPGSLGCWIGNRSYTVAHAGQCGYHQRTEANKWILKIGDKPKEVNRVAGFGRYGLVRNNYLLIKGSIQGPSKRLIIFTNPMRKNYKAVEAPSIQYIKQ